MTPDPGFLCRVLAAPIAIASLAGCEVIRDVGEFCSRESLEVTTTADIRRPCDETECSLWGAIAAANTCSSGMTVMIPAGSQFVYGAPPPDAGIAPADTIFPAITGRLTIEGNGAELGRLSAGAPPYRFFLIREGGNLSISNLSMQGGDPGRTYGGAILNHGMLTLVQANLTDNRSGTGGAIDNRGRLTVRGGQFTDNLAVGCDEYGGGAIRNADGAVATIESVTFTGNQGCGGAIYNQGRVNVVESTFSGNRGGGEDQNIFNVGGGVLNETVGETPATATIIGSTFTGNRALTGAAIANWRGSEMTLRSSTLSGNVAYVPCPQCLEDEKADRVDQAVSAGISESGLRFDLADVTIFGNTCEDALPDCVSGILYSGPRSRVSIRNTIIAGHPSGVCRRLGGDPAGSPALTAIGASLATDDSCPGFTVRGEPLLGPLADNGGPTRTHALLPGSPALDAGTSCTTQDQRGEPRARSAADPCDIGAFELQR